jgi:hypothetical protein
MRPVYDLIATNVPELQKVGALLTTHVYDRVIAGEIILIGEVKVGPKKSWLEELHAVIRESRVIEDTISVNPNEPSSPFFQPMDIDKDE